MSDLIKVSAGHYTFGEFRIEREAGRSSRWNLYKGEEYVLWTRTLRKGAEVVERMEKAAQEAAQTLEQDAELMEAFQVDHRIINDIRAKFERWGSISEKQRALVLKIADDQTRERGFAPDGEGQVLGKVLSVKDHWGDWGHSLKMTVELANGSRVWGTKPSRQEVESGDVVSFYSKNISRSAKDASFAFFKRPSKFQVNSPRDRIEWLYQKGEVCFDIYESAVLSLLGDEPVSFEDGEVGLREDGTFMVEFDDEREERVF